MSVEIVTCPPDRFAELFAVAEVAFAENVSAELVKRIELVADKERFVTALDGGRIVSSGGVFTQRLTVPGGELPAGGVTWVTVLPTHRRQGILSGMMRRMIDDCRARGEAVAILWASEAAIYQRFGYGLATWSMSVDAETRSSAFVRPRAVEGSFRLVPPGEALPIVEPVYLAARRRYAGFLARSPQWWSGHLPDPDKDARGGDAKRCVVYTTDDGPEAYAVYSVKADWSERGTAGRLTVHEAIGSTRRGTREIWRYLLDVDLVRGLRAWRLPPDHPLPLLVAEPRRLAMTIGDGLWLRIVDVPAALEGRTYGGDGMLTIDLRDDFCDWNAGCWTIDVDGGRARVTRAQSAADLALSANELGMLLLGGHTATSLAEAGRIEELRDGALATADHLFVTARHPWCPEEF